MSRVISRQSHSAAAAASSVEIENSITVATTNTTTTCAVTTTPSKHKKKKKNKKDIEDQHLQEITMMDHDDKKKEASSKSSRFLSNFNCMISFRLILLIAMVVQNSSVVLVGRHTRSSTNKEDMFIVSHFILITELAKLIGSCILESYTTNYKLIQSIRTNIFQNPMDTLKISIPALLYLLQNTLLYIALSNLSAPLFQVTYQSKLLTTALVSVVMLNRRYSMKQWICLACLGFGVAIVVLGENSNHAEKSNATSSAAAVLVVDDKEEGIVADTAAAAAVAGSLNVTSDSSSSSSQLSSSTTTETPQEEEQNMALGLIAVLIACFSSAFAGVYFEKVLKKAPSPANAAAAANNKAPVSLWMRNIQLAFFSVCIAFIQYVYENQKKHEKEEVVLTTKPTLLHGFNMWVWILVLLQAGGGLLIAAIIKYADNVLKGLATGVAVAVSTLCSMILFRTPLTLQFTFGASIILCSVYFFSNGAGAGAGGGGGGGGGGKSASASASGASGGVTAKGGGVGRSLKVSNTGSTNHDDDDDDDEEEDDNVLTGGGANNASSCEMKPMILPK